MCSHDIENDTCKQCDWGTSSQQLLDRGKPQLHAETVRGDPQIVACERLSLVCFASFPLPYISITALQEDRTQFHE